MSGAEDTEGQQSETQQSEIAARLQDARILAYKYLREQPESFRVSNNDEKSSKEIIDQLSFFATPLHPRNIDRFRSLVFPSSMNASPSALSDDERKETAQKYLKAIFPDLDEASLQKITLSDLDGFVKVSILYERISSNTQNRQEI